MKKIFSNKYLLYSIGIVLIFVLWIIISLVINDPVLVFPDPIRTISCTIDLLTQPILYKNIFSTLIKLLIGFLSSFILAFLISLLCNRFKNLQEVIKPIVNVLKAIPTVALVFLFIVLVKPQFTPVLIVILICFPILYEAMIGGLNSIPKEINDSSSIDSPSKMKTLFQIKLPLSIPYIFVGIASSLALSFKVEIMAEIVSGDTGYGIGSAIKNARNADASNMVPVFAYCLIAIIIALIIDIICHIIKRKISKKYNV